MNVTLFYFALFLFVQCTGDTNAKRSLRENNTPARLLMDAQRYQIMADSAQPSHPSPVVFSENTRWVCGYEVVISG